MPDHDLHSFMAQVTNDMGAEYKRIYARAAEDPGTAGDEGEGNWAKLLKDWLPPSYHVETKGRLISDDGRMSPQIDVVVLKPAYPRKLLEKKIWLAGGVAAVFECKNTLTASDVTKSLYRCVQFKNLYSPREGTPRLELRSPLIYGLLAHSHSWKGENSAPIDNIDRVLNASEPSVTHPRLELDILCVADLATWSSMVMPRYDASWSASPATLIQAFGAPCGPMTVMNCSSAASYAQHASFRPVGALIEDLTSRLAWADPSVRDIAEYFRKANLGGSGAGKMRPWPLSVYSDEVARFIASGRITNGLAWDDWSAGGL